MRNPLSQKITGIQPSGIRKFFDIVSEMPDAISLGVGEPDFDTPWNEEKKEYMPLRREEHFTHLMQVLRNYEKRYVITLQER